MERYTNVTGRPLRRQGRTAIVMAVVIAAAGGLGPRVWFGEAVAGEAVAAEESTLVIRAGELHIGTGEVIQNGMLVITGERIVEVGVGLSVPTGATVIDVGAMSVTPGLIDADAHVETADMFAQPQPASRYDDGFDSAGREVAGRSKTNGRSSGSTSARWASGVLHGFFCHTHKESPKPGCCGSSCPTAYAHATGQTCEHCGFPNGASPDAASSLAVGTSPWSATAEHSSEIVPQTRMIDTLNLRSRDFDRLLAGGVTTVFASPSGASVIGSQGAIVHTGGPLGRRVVRESGAITAVMGQDAFRRERGNTVPWRSSVSFFARRPTTRMGVAWVFRKALYDTQRFEQGLDVHGADTPSEPAMAVLSRVLAGDVGLRIQARMQHDILAAIRLAGEFNVPFVLEEGTEAHRCLEELKQTKTSVIYGPIYESPTGYRARTSESNGARFHTLRALLDAGIETALTAQELREEDGLARQAMYAMRFGASRAEAMRAVTVTPAKLLGLDGELGTLRQGARADVVVWSGPPFEASSRALVVVIGGRIVLDRRQG